MVNPLAKLSMEKNLNDKDKNQVFNQISNVVVNLDAKESELIQSIIKNDTKSRLVSLDEAVERIKNSR